jgi:hypothetical protein
VVDDVAAAIAAYIRVTAHVQIADAPGRGELDLDRYLAALEDHGYRGWVSLEYNPTTTTEASLAWLPRERRAAPTGSAAADAAPAEGRSKHEHADRVHRAGHQGAPIAANLVKAGFDVTGYNRSPAARCSSARGPRCWLATSSPASGSRYTTRTWASSPPPPARPAW